MFTRCPACRTVFHITAAELRAADGTVICGACDTTFDALDTLSETRPADAEPPGVAPIRDEAAFGSPQREAPHDEAPTAGAAAQLAPPADDALLEAIDADEARDEQDFLEELESLIGGDDGLDDPFTGTGTGAGFESATSARKEIEPFDQGFGATRAGLDEGELAAADFGPAAPDEAEPGDFELEENEPDELALDKALPDVAAGRPEWESATGLDEEEYRGGEVDFEIVEASLEDEAEAGLLADEFEDELPDPDSVFRVDELDEEDGRPAMEPASGVAGKKLPSAGTADPEFDDEDDEPAASPTAEPLQRVRAGATPVAEAEAEPEFVREPRRGRGWRRILLALLALLLLGGTWAHSQHGKLLRHPLGESVLLPVYGLLGREVAPDWDPSAYRALHWEAVAERDRPGYLTVGVDFQNTAGFAQPYPVIRIVLEDRFGQRLGVHDASPGEYLRAHTSDSRLPAGGRVRTSVVAPDPGARADGFRVDFCLEVHGRGLVCGPEPFR